MRMRAMIFSRWVIGYGLGRADAAARVGISAETLREWEAVWARDRMAIVARGRRVETVDRETRECVLGALQLMGPGLGLPTLQAMFPEVARRELQELQTRYRDAFMIGGTFVVMALRWLRAGAVWAMDYTNPPTPIDGTYEKVLMVRDLASGAQLLSLPAEGESGRVTADALIALFLEHGAPLAIKSDNGSPLVAEEVERVLSPWKVWHLRSPSWTPEYNGAVEAGIGSVKTRAHHEAARNDRPGEWTCDDVETGRLQGNELARPRGLKGPTPNEAWRERVSISDEEREAFAAAVEAAELRVRQDEGLLPGVQLDERKEQTIRRAAISRALIDAGYLRFRRRRITEGIKSRFWRKIS